MITHLIKPGTVFFFNKSNDDLDLPAGVLMVVTEKSPSGIWVFRHLSREVDHTAFIDGVKTRILFKYDDVETETIIGQLPPNELHMTEWQLEYLLPSISHTKPPANRLATVVRHLKRLW